MTFLSDDVRAKLRTAGIRSTDALVGKCSTIDERFRMHAVTGLEPDALREMAMIAELFRLKRVGAQYVNLLVATGIGGLKLLSACESQQLLEAMGVHNRSTPYVRQLPRTETVEEWISSARGMSSKVV